MRLGLRCADPDLASQTSSPGFAVGWLRHRRLHRPWLACSLSPGLLVVRGLWPTPYGTAPLLLPALTVP